MKPVSFFKTTLIVFIVTIFVTAASAQTTTFTYQGSLKSGGVPANGSFDFWFTLFDASSAGNQLGSTNLLDAVTVTNGTFSVALTFTNQFTGGNRFLEIRVRPAGSGAYTILTPRQQISSTPYSIKSLSADSAANATSATTAGTATNSLQLGGVAASQYVQSGAPTINAGTQFNINGSRILAVGSGTSNTFGGINAGANASNLSDNNTFFGNNAGQTMVTAGGNSFFGSQAGQNTTGGANTFVGALSGKANTSGDSNSFLGYNPGTANTTGDNNAFFGRSAGSANQTGSGNSFFGYQAGLTANTSNNSFFGYQSGRLTTGINNSFFGWSSGVGTTTGTNNSFFGVQSGLSNTTGIDNSSFGRDAGRDNVSGSGNSFFGRNSGILSTGTNNTFVGLNAGNTNVGGSSNTVVGANADVGSSSLDFATAIGAGAGVTSSNTVVLGRTADTVQVKGKLKVSDLLATDETNTGFRYWMFTTAWKIQYTDISPPSGNHACYGQDAVTNGYYFGLCPSSIRYKENVERLSLGLETIRRLRPVSFDWKRDGKHSLGLIAEEVDAAEPLLSIKNRDGIVESVNYDGVTAVLVNAVREQQTQIEKLQNQVAALMVDNRTIRMKLRKIGATRKSKRSR